MGKIKEFCKKHKDEIEFVLTFSASIGAAIGLGWCLRAATLDKRTRILLDDNVRNVIDSAHQTYGNKNIVFTGWNEGTYKASELGKLGEKILELTRDGEDAVFTHFIAVGPHD